MYISRWLCASKWHKKIPQCITHVKIKPRLNFHFIISGMTKGARIHLLLLAKHGVSDNIFCILFGGIFYMIVHVVQCRPMTSFAVNAGNKAFGIVLRVCIYSAVFYADVRTVAIQAVCIYQPVKHRFVQREARACAPNI